MVKSASEVTPTRWRPRGVMFVYARRPTGGRGRAKGATAVSTAHTGRDGSGCRKETAPWDAVALPLPSACTG